ncbi:MAG: Maf family protein [Bdellovibrionia bacterium]
MKTGSRIPVVLASTSPRRADLMNQIRLDFQVQAPFSDEIAKAGELPKKLVARLAREKAESVKDIVTRTYGDSLIISADTIVVAPDGKTILGKPKGVKEASAMLKLLAGKTHSVYTGYCIYHAKKVVAKTSKKNGQGRILVRVVKSKVKMRKLSPSMIQRYVATGEPMDKAGSYGAQGMGTALVEKIEGSYTNVVGLPMAEIVVDLEKFNLKLFTWLK